MTRIFSCWTRRPTFLLLGVIMLALGMFLSQGQELSWAASNQSPQAQTVPPRPTVTLSPAEPTPDTRRKDNHGRDYDDEASSPAGAPGQDASIGDKVTPPDQPPSSGQTRPGGETFRPAKPFKPGGEGNEAPVPSSQETPQLQPGRELPVVYDQADLSLNQYVDNASPEVGDKITLVTEVSNGGPDNATQVAISQPVPLGLRVELATASQGSFNESQGLWTIAGITAGQTISLSLKAEVTEAGAITTTAEIIRADQFDPNSTPGNGSSQEDDQSGVVIMVSAKTGPPQAHDLATVLVPTSALARKAHSVSVAAWFYGLIGGIMLLLGGMFLVRRS